MQGVCGEGGGGKGGDGDGDNCEFPQASLEEKFPGDGASGECSSVFASQLLLPPPPPPASESIHSESNLITEI